MEKDQSVSFSYLEKKNIPPLNCSLNIILFYLRGMPYGMPICFGDCFLQIILYVLRKGKDVESVSPSTLLKMKQLLSVGTNF